MPRQRCERDVQLKALSPLVVPGQPWYCYSSENGVHKEHAARERLESCHGMDPKTTHTVENTSKMSLPGQHYSGHTLGGFDYLPPPKT